jgi:magnesium chelatase subunit D
MAGAAAWRNACEAAAIFAVDPAGVGGVSLRALAGPARDRWMALLRSLLPADTLLRRVPLHIRDERLLGGLDLAATLRAGRPVAEQGLLAEADGHVLVLAMAERLTTGAAARLTASLDQGEVVLERDGLALRRPLRAGVVALDEAIADDEAPPAALLDRLAFHVDLTGIAISGLDVIGPDAADIADARVLLPQVRVEADSIEALCATTLALGIGSARAALLALRVARIAAALDGRDLVNTEDAALAARLVFASRATRLPNAEPAEAPPSEEDPAPDDPPPPDDSDAGEDGEPEAPPVPPEDLVLAAAQAAIPAGLLAQLTSNAMSAGRQRTPGRAGASQASRLRGRPIGVTRGELKAGVHLNLVETLRAAAPWQRLRQAHAAPGAARVKVRGDDVRVTRFRQRARTTTIFVVDASGSSALQRLAEAKGAVELMLADCYVRRDQVAVIGFRKTSADLLVPPTSSLVRAKRSLAGLPGGGTTPLACGIEAALALADAVGRKGDTPVIILLTDGQANITREGTQGRPKAQSDALSAARAIKAAGIRSILLDTSPRSQPLARGLADAMGARYVALPAANAATMAKAVTSVVLS